MLSARDTGRARGFGTALLIRADGRRERIPFRNLITQIGDQYYMERAAGLGSLPAAAGMKLGTGTTAVAKTGAGAGLVTYVSGSHAAFDSNTSSLNGSARRITYVSSWAAGVATAIGLAEAVIVAEASLQDSTSVAAECISRILFGSTFDKGAGDTLELTWHHEFEGA